MKSNKCKYCGNYGLEECDDLNMQTGKLCDYFIFDIDAFPKNIQKYIIKRIQKYLDKADQNWF